MKTKYIYALLATLLLAVVAFFFFYPDDVTGRVLQQHDIQQGLANGHEIQEYEQATGEKARWTNSLFSGMPTFQIAPSYPASGMLSWISSIYTLWLPSPANLLFGMMFGFFIMLLCMRYKWYTALLGAIGWGLSSYFVIIIGAGHIWKFLTLMYIPPTIGGLALLYRGRYIASTALTSVFAALQLMSNHIQMTYYFLFVAAALIIGWLIEAIRNKETGRWIKATLLAIGAALLAVGANSASLYNTYQYSKETIRGNATELSSGGSAQENTGGSDIDYITQWSYGKGETLSLLIPNVRGGATVKPKPGESGLKSLAETPYIEEKYEAGEISPEIYQFIAQMPQYFGEQPMTNGPVYVGSMLLMLAILSFFCVKGPMKWCLLAVSVLSIFLAWGHNFYAFTEFFVNYFPGYNKFRTPSSMLVVVEFTVPLLAVMCVREIITNPEFFKTYSRQFYTVFGLGAFICLIGWLSPSILAGGSGISSQEAEWFASSGLLNDLTGIQAVNHIGAARLSLISSDCIRSLTFIGLGFGILMLYFKHLLKSRRITVCLLSAAALLDLFAVNKRYIDSENFTEKEEPETEFRMTEADRIILKDKGHYRVFDADNFSSARSSYFHKTIGGYHAAKLTRYNDLITAQISKGNEHVLDMLNARYAISQGKAIQRTSALGNAWFVDSLIYVNGADAEMSALNTLNPGNTAIADMKFKDILGNADIGTPGDTIFLIDYTPDRLTYKYSTAAPRTAVFSEIYFPWGWQATIDGNPVEIGRANYVLRALRLPAGNHEIKFTFNPASLNVTNWIGIVCVIIIYALVAAAICMAFISAKKRSREQETKEKLTPRQ